jgi:hypothetical protein
MYRACASVCQLTVVKCSPMMLSSQFCHWPQNRVICVLAGKPQISRFPSSLVFLFIMLIYQKRCRLEWTRHQKRLQHLGLTQNVATPCKTYGNNDRALCISRCKRDRTNASNHCIPCPRRGMVWAGFYLMSHCQCVPPQHNSWLFVQFFLYQNHYLHGCSFWDTWS